MGKGYDENQLLKNELNFLGKDLVRRSRSKCELCEADGVNLTVLDVPPASVPVSADQCLFLCDELISLFDQLGGPSLGHVTLSFQFLCSQLCRGPHVARFNKIGCGASM